MTIRRFSAALYVTDVVEPSTDVARQAGAALGPRPRLAAKVAAPSQRSSPNGCKGRKSRFKCDGPDYRCKNSPTCRLFQRSNGSVTVSQRGWTRAGQARKRESHRGRPRRDRGGVLLGCDLDEYATRSGARGPAIFRTTSPRFRGGQSTKSLGRRSSRGAQQGSRCKFVILKS